MDMGGTSNFEDFEMETWLEEQNDLGDYPDGFNPELWGLWNGTGTPLGKKEHFSMAPARKKTTKKKPPRWFRILRYNFNCMWYHVLMPVGMPEDDFSKMIRENRKKRNNEVEWW